jgi:hypothetical protein
LHYQQQRWADSLGDLEEALKLGTTGTLADTLAGYLHEKGRVLLKQKKYDAALKAAGDALNVKADYAPAFRLQAEAHLGAPLAAPFGARANLVGPR